MAFIAREFKIWAGTDHCVWAQHYNESCMEVETWDYTSLEKILDWVDSHVCNARL